MLPESMWSALTEVSLLFHILCSKMLYVNKVQELEASVATILCNLEKIFPTSFFYSIEHLIAHFSYKAHVQGPVQYRWMYSFESSLYFESRVLCKRNMPRRNDDLAMNETCIQQSIFNSPGQASGASKKIWLSGSKFHIIKMHILINCEVVMPYYNLAIDMYVNGSFLNELYEKYHPENPIIEELVAIQFKDWFKRRVKTDLPYIDNELLKLHYWGPSAGCRWL
ncbi:UNVERIFIED_CONTAM: hypothetical protein Sangu_0191500 [Sesamum angustifolium]|uniref:DUF4218 domain-containing protein n=1 Tax=Sesamum angustifolium TaxID=2727405 RepID=A0AAW2RM29_9LAMI